MTWSRIDLGGVTTYPLATRRNKVTLDQDFALPVRHGMTVSDLLKCLPDQMGGRTLNRVVDAVAAARAKGKPVVMAMGAHVIKCGLQPVLKSLIEADVISAIALNGAGIIHDYEISLIGATSEDVGAALHSGNFGMAEETGRDLNRAIREGVEAGMGLGEAIGRFILANNNPYREQSLIAACVERGIPVTVHVAVGTDIIHQHPTADGSAIGEASFRDFRLLAGIVSHLGDGGVYFNIGSAVLLPEVFLKALSIAQNLGHQVDHFTTVNMDMQQHYRPLQNVVQRPTAGESRGYTLTGHHEIMLPLLAAAVLDKVQGSRF
jgi:hypothetical protein